MANRKAQNASESSAAGPDPAGWWPVSPEYLEQSRRPLVSLAFIIPLLATYEGGVIYLGPAALRNGADVWLRHLLGRIGLGHYFLLPALTVGLLLAWHHTTHQRWKMRRQIVLGMYLESAVLAFGLLGIGYLERNLSQLALAALNADTPVISEQDSAGRLRELPSRDASNHDRSSPAARAKQTPPGASAPTSNLPRGEVTAGIPSARLLTSSGARVIGFCGAGIYEEALFRLLMLPPVIWLLGMFSITRAARVGLAIVATSVLFSAAHYIGVQGEAFEWFSASFRCVAGIFFASLFVHRGFGIAAGTHALYDVLVGLA